MASAAEQERLRILAEAARCKREKEEEERLKKEREEEERQSMEARIAAADATIGMNSCHASQHLPACVHECRPEILLACLPA